MGDTKSFLKAAWELQAAFKSLLGSVHRFPRFIRQSIEFTIHPSTSNNQPAEQHHDSQLLRLCGIQQQLSKPTQLSKCSFGRTPHNNPNTIHHLHTPFSGIQIIFEMINTAAPTLTFFIIALFTQKLS
jgi:hypothetical protein